MKLIIAYIQPDKLTDIKKNLFEKDITKMSVTNALGCGSQGGYSESYRGSRVDVNLLKKIRLEIAVNDNVLQKTIDTLVSVARTGNIGDGKIFVLDITETIRIRTGEKGKKAIG